jgi:hypothetical protein
MVSVMRSSTKRMTRQRYSESLLLLLHRGILLGSWAGSKESGVREGGRELVSHGEWLKRRGGWRVRGMEALEGEREERGKGRGGAATASGHRTTRYDSCRRGRGATVIPGIE